MKLWCRQVSLNNQAKRYKQINVDTEHREPYIYLSQNIVFKSNVHY